MVDKNKINIEYELEPLHLQKVDKAFKLGEKGSVACLDLIEKSINKIPGQAQHALAGALSELMLVCYAMSSTEEQAEELISLANKYALGKWESR